MPQYPPKGTPDVPEVPLIRSPMMPRNACLPDGWTTDGCGFSVRCFYWSLSSSALFNIFILSAGEHTFPLQLFNVHELRLYIYLSWCPQVIKCSCASSNTSPNTRKLSSIRELLLCIEAFVIAKCKTVNLFSVGERYETEYGNALKINLGFQQFQSEWFYHELFNIYNFFFRRY